jgi:hypothetical protein
MEIEKHTINNIWKVWFHKIDDKDWSINSYNNVANIDSLESFIYYYRKISIFIHGMFFVMKDNIPPLWEDKNNINGGIITYKFTKVESDDVWKQLTMALIGNTLTKDSKYINGISISPKINNCIIKIWVNKSNILTKIKFNEELEFIKNNIPIFKTFNNTSY